MAARQQFAADFSEGDEAASGEIGQIDGAFVVVELANEKVPVADVCPSEKWVGLNLHGALAGDNTLSVVGPDVAIVGQVGRIDRRGFLLDLEKERIVGAVGVIGPTRLNYSKIVPMVDYTAQLVSRLMR